MRETSSSDARKQSNYTYLLHPVRSLKQRVSASSLFSLAPAIYTSPVPNRPRIQLYSRSNDRGELASVLRFQVRQLPVKGNITDSVLPGE